MSEKGKLYLIPNTLGDYSPLDVMAPNLGSSLENVSLIFVEKEKVARRLLIGLGLKEKLQDFRLISIKHGFNASSREVFESTVKSGKDVAIISDAGCPAVADPGYEIVALAHMLRVEVRPKVGPSSIILALMASGFNGQQFTFHGYLPKELGKRRETIKHLERDAVKNNRTHIFIETPFRNQHLLKDLIQTCEKNTKICLAVDLTLEDEWIRTASVNDWRADLPDIHKKQCIFLLHK